MEVVIMKLKEITREYLKKQGYKERRTQGEAVYYVKDGEDLVIVFGMHLSKEFKVLLDRRTCEKIKWRSIFINEKGDGKLVPSVKYKGKTESLHKMCMQAHGVQKNANETDIDHINHNRFDCRFENLRFCTRNQNQLNRSSSNITESDNEEMADYLYSYENDFLHEEGIDWLIHCHALGDILKSMLLKLNREYWEARPYCLKQTV